MLNKNELAEFKWTVKEYIKYGEENAIDQRWMKELENASAKHHIDKLTALKLECQAEYDKAFNAENQKVTDAVKEAYTDRYDHVGYEVQKGFNVGFKLNGISEEKLDKVIRKPWAPDGKNFSDRIWTKKEQMVEELYQALVRNTLGGSNLKDVIESMTKYVDKSTKNAKSVAARLVMTESAYFASQGQKDCFNDLGVEKYEIVATLDNKTSDICQGLDGKVFEMKEFEPGVTAPPFHVNCRSTTAPYFDDEFSLGERAARDAEGKTYYVPSDMTYKEWKGKQDEFKQETTQKSQNNNIIYEIDIDNKFGKSIKEIIDRLQSEYNNPNLKRVVKYHQSGNSKNEGGNCAPGGENISLRWKDPQNVVHEYFHSLIQKQFNTKNIDNEAFWKEIDTIYKDYRKAMSQRDFRDYIITDYANTNAEEFAAEAFSAYKLNQWGMEMPHGIGENLTFANRVGNVVDKFFSKNKYNDITDKWIEKTKVGSYVECESITINGMTYKVGDNGVVLDLNNRTSEVEIAKVLAEKYGKEVVILPEISGKNANIKTADLMVNGKPVEIKTINASGPNTIKNAIKHAKGQANDIIINIGDTKLTTDEIIETIQRQFNNIQCQHMESCVVIKNGEVLKVFEQKKLVGTAAMLKHHVAPTIDNITTKPIKSQLQSDEKGGKIFINNINNAKTIEEINKIATKHFVNKDNCTISTVNLDGIDIDIAKEVVIKADDLTDRFKTTLISIKSDDLERRTDGETRITEASAQKCVKLKDSKYLQSNIALSKKLHSDKQNIEQQYLANKSSEEPFLVVVNERNKYISTFVHEFGHSILSGAANDILAKYGCRINQVVAECKKLREEYKNKCQELIVSVIRAKRIGNDETEKKAYDDLKKYEVSIYSRDEESWGEFIAECFADYELSDTPKEISKKLYDILVKEFGK